MEQEFNPALLRLVDFPPFLSPSMLGFRNVFVKLNPKGRDKHHAGAAILNWKPIGSSAGNKPYLIVVWSQHYRPKNETQERKQMLG